MADLRFGDEAAPALLFLPALFEEMNRTRALLPLRRCALLASGRLGLLRPPPISPGTGESETALEAVEWRHWRDAAIAAAAVRATAVASLRGGCLLDDLGLPAWRLAPVTGAALVRDLERTGLVGASGGGYAPSEGLIEALRTAVPAGDRVRTARLASDPAPADVKFDASPLWEAVRAAGIPAPRRRHRRRRRGLGPPMRRLFSFPCEGVELGASLDEATGATGLLIVVGGSQTRIGSHRMFERLAMAVAAAGHPCMRFDRRGVGDSSGEDPGWRGSGPDIAAAAAAFRREAPGVTRIVALGLCDGAGALCLHGAAAGVDELLLVNPWLVEASENAPAPAALRRHYRERFTTLGGWRKLLSGSVSYTSALRSLLRAGSKTQDTTSKALAAALRDFGLPAAWILAEGDATAVAAAHELDKRHWRGLADRRTIVPTDSHTFARPGDAAGLQQAVLAALGRGEG